MRRTACVTVLSGLVLSTGLLTAAPAGAAAATLVVDADGQASAASCADPDPAAATIGDAVASAADGDTIIICPGTYAETVSTGLSLTFLGAQAGVDARGRTGAETVVDGGGATAFTLSGAGATVDGLTVTGSTTNEDTGAVNLLGTGQTVTNTVFDANSAASIITGSEATFTRNAVVAKPAGSFGFFFNSGGGSGSVVDRNDFTGDFSTPNGGSAVNVADFQPLDGITISDNTADITEGGNFVVLGGTRNAVITGNEVTGSANSGTGMLLLGDDADYTISDNVLTGLANASAISVSGGFGYPTNGGGAIERNVLTGNRRGINVFDAAGTLEVHSNVIVGNVGTGTTANPFAGIRNVTPAVVNAENNYFGCDGGPGATGCDVALNTGTGSLVTSPWVVLSSTVGASLLTPTQTTAFTADLNHNSAGAIIPQPLPSSALTATFAFTKGSVDPVTAPFVGGVATTTLTAGTAPGQGQATVTTANSSSSKPVQVVKPMLRISDASKVEGNTGTSVMTFRVTMNRPSLQTVKVKFQTADSSAVAGSDYAGKKGSVTFAPGTTTQTISIVIRGDRVVEPSESFFVTIFGPTNAFVIDANGSGVIRNDD